MYLIKQGHPCVHTDRSIMQTYFLYYLLAINALSFIITGLDKRKAARNLSRTPERTLFFLAFIGGSAGVLGAMYVFRHKTKHKSFIYGVPLILAVQAAAVFFIYFKVLEV